MPNKPDKTVSITVTETGTASSKTIAIDIGEDPVDLKGHGQKAVQIQWEIDGASTPGWALAPNGVTIGGTDFDDDGPSKKPHKRHAWTRKANHAKGGFVKYSITVTRVDAGGASTTIVVDPAINNEA